MKFKKNTAESIKITVSKNGQGIAKDHQKRVFERFFQADDSSIRQSEETGIGLTLVK
jgi:signal transduction histidine kinase